LLGKTPISELGHDSNERDPKDLRHFLSGFKEELLQYIK